MGELSLGSAVSYCMESGFSCGLMGLFTRAMPGL